MSFSDNNPRSIEDLLNIFGESSMNGIATKVANSGSEIKASDFQQGNLTRKGAVATGDGDNFIVGDDINNRITNNNSGQYFDNLQSQLSNPVSWSSSPENSVIFNPSSTELGQNTNITFDEGGDITITATYQDAYNGIFTFDINLTIDSIPQLDVPTDSWEPSFSQNTSAVTYTFTVNGGDPNTNQVRYKLEAGTSNVNVVGPGTSFQTGNKGDSLVVGVTVNSTTGSSESYTLSPIIQDVSTKGNFEPIVFSSPVYTTELL